LYFVMADEAARHFCLTGKSGVDGVKKRKFMGTKIYNLIMGVSSCIALESIFLFKNCYLLAEICVL
jgi:hypothetical protein